MLRDIALFFGGGLLLYFGAEWLVRGSAGLAAKLRIRPLIIGLTIVAYGTSAPELVVSVNAAIVQRAGIAFGDVIGSNICNIALILGLAALISPPRIDPSLRRREVPVLVLSSLAIPLVLIDGRVSRIEGAGLTLAAVIYTILAIRTSRTSYTSSSSSTSPEQVEPAPQSVRSQRASALKLAAIAVVGLALLLVGGKWFVEGASRLAIGFGISERIVGLTIVAIGTSMPELATSVIAARRGHSDIAVGNVIGSNIFNALLILGSAALVSPLELSLHGTRIEIVGLLITTVVGAFLLSRQGTPEEPTRIRRIEGAVLLSLYIVFLIVLGR